MAGERSYFVDSLLGFAGTIAQEIGRTNAGDLAMLKGQLDLLSVEYTDKMKRTGDYASIVDEKGGGIYGEWNAAAQKLVEGVGPLAKRQAQSLLLQYQASQKDFALKTQWGVQQGAEKTKIIEGGLASIDAGVKAGGYEAMPGYLALGYRDTVTDLVQNAGVDPATASAVYMAATKPKVMDSLIQRSTAAVLAGTKTVEQAIAELGIVGDLSIAQGVSKASVGTMDGSTAVYHFTDDDKKAMVTAFQKGYETIRAEKQDVMDNGLVTLAFQKQEWNQVYGQLSSPEVKRWMTPEKQAYWWSLYRNAIADKDSPAETDDQAVRLIEDMFFKECSTKEISLMVEQFNRTGALKGTSTSKYRGMLETPPYDIPELSSLKGQLDKRVADKKLKPEEAAKLYSGLMEYAQTHRKGLKPGELNVYLSEMQAGDFKTKMTSALTSIASGSPIWIPEPMRDEFIKTQEMVQSGKLDAGLVRSYLYDSGPSKGTEVYRGPMMDRLEILKEGHTQLWLQDFGEKTKPKVSFAIATDGVVHAGQPIFTHPDGTQYVYMVPEGKSDEFLFKKTADGWVEASSDTPKAKAAAAAKASLDASKTAAAAKAEADWSSTTLKPYFGAISKLTTNSQKRKYIDDEVAKIKGLMSQGLGDKKTQQAQIDALLAARTSYIDSVDLSSMPIPGGSR